MRAFDVVVIGLGAVGAAAMRSLAERGAQVLGLELDAPAHGRGSSHGHCRIFRHAYFEHADYVPLLQHATKRFESLEREADVALLHRCGVLLLGEPDSTVLRRSRDAALVHGLDVESLDRAEIGRRFPWFVLPGSAHGLFERDAGLVRPEAAIHASLHRAKACGAELRLGVRVRELRPSTNGVVVATDGEPVHTRHVVVAAGAWAKQLLPELAPLLRVTRQVQSWVAPRIGTDVRSLPCWLLDRGPTRPSLYGIPADPLAPSTSPARVPKVAFHGLTEEVDPDIGARESTGDDLDPLRVQYERLAPSLCGAHVDAATCLYTMSPDGDFVVGPSRALPNVHFAAGLSGHGFKLSPALGDALADLALTGTTELPIGFLSPQRFARVASRTPERQDPRPVPDSDATSELLDRLARCVGLEGAPTFDEPSGPIDLTRAECLEAIGEPSLRRELERSAAEPLLSSHVALTALLQGRRTDEPVALAASGESLLAALLARHPGRVIVVGEALAFLGPNARIERRSEADAESALEGASLVVLEPGLLTTVQPGRLVRAARGAGCAVALDATRTAFRVGATLDAGCEDLDADYVLFGPALAAGLPLFAARGLAAPDLEPDPFAVAVACAVVRTLRDRPLHAELVRVLAVLRSTVEREAAAQEIRVRVDGVAGLPRLVFLGQEDAPGELIAEHFARELELAGVRMRGPLLLPPSLRLDAGALDAACRAFAHAFVRIRALLVEYNSHLSGGLPWPFRTGQDALRTRGLTFYRYPRRAEVDVGSNGEAMRIAFGRSQLGPVTSSGFYVPTRLVGDVTLTIRYALRQWNAGPDSACLGLFFQNEASTARYYAQVLSTCDAPTQRSVAAGLAGNVVGRRPIDGDEGWLRLCRSGDVLVATWRAGADLPWVELGRCEATPDPLIAGCKIWSKVATEGLVADLFDLQIEGELAADQPELLPAREDPRHG